MQTGYEDIQAEGAKLIAISADPVDLVDSTRQSLEITYPLLVDDDRKTIIAYNVLDPSDTKIARPATYIINEEGRVVSKFLNDIGSRIGPDEILTELKNL